MFILLFISAVLAATFLSAENLVVTVAGAIVTILGTQWIKSATGIYRLGALILAIAISILVAGVAMLVSSYLSGGELSLDVFFRASTQIFALATIAYKIVTDHVNTDED